MLVKNMKAKIKRLIFPTRPGLENKWWHRLSMVLICGTTAVLVVIAIISFVSKIPEWRTSRYIYSFEPQYSKMLSRSELCDFKVSDGYSDHSVNCGNFYFLNSEELISFLNRYNNTFLDKNKYIIKISCVSTKSLYEKYVCDKKPSIQSVTEWVLSQKQGPNDKYIEVVDYPVFNTSIENGEFANIKAKRVIDYDTLLESIALLVAIPLAWFIFWMSIIYRTMLYIIYGKRN